MFTKIMLDQVYFSYFNVFKCSIANWILVCFKCVLINRTLFLIIDATVFFEKSHYAFREGEIVSVPITLNGNITFPVNVR